MNREEIREFVAQVRARAAAIPKEAVIVLTPEQQREKELSDAYRRGYEDGKSSSYSWRV